MSKNDVPELEKILDEATSALPKVTAKKMFGCRALMADEKIFALVWKEGRIGVKLPDAESYASLKAISGSKPWSPGGMRIGAWLLVPPAFHSKPAELRKWAALAHEQCRKLETKKKPAAKKKKAK